MVDFLSKDGHLEGCNDNAGQDEEPREGEDAAPSLAACFVNGLTYYAKAG
jgi:hypothetical protein